MRHKFDPGLSGAEWHDESIPLLPEAAWPGGSFQRPSPSPAARCEAARRACTAWPPPAPRAPRRFRDSTRRSRTARHRASATVPPSQIDAHAEGIERRHLHLACPRSEVAAECQPAEFGVIDDVGGRVEGVAEEVRTVVAGVADRTSACRGRRGTRRRRSLPGRCCERAHRAAVADAQQVEVVRMLAILGQHRNGVDARSRSDGVAARCG